MLSGLSHETFLACCWCRFNTDRVKAMVATWLWCISTAAFSTTQSIHWNTIDPPQLCRFNTDHVKAGSPWGAGTFAGADGSRQPTDVELAYAKHQVGPVV